MGIGGKRVAALLLAALSASACASAEDRSAPAATSEPSAVSSTMPGTPGSMPAPGTVPGVLGVDDIPIARTPPGGYGDDVPPPVLAGCVEPLPADAPDLRGWWRVTEVEVGGSLVADHRAQGSVQRIEQCGDRLVVTAAGVVHDMRADGTEENGVHDVAEADKTTPIVVVATYEEGVHVLRPVGIPGVEVTRALDGDQMVWGYLGFTARLDRVAPADADAPLA